MTREKNYSPRAVLLFETKRLTIRTHFPNEKRKKKRQMFSPTSTLLMFVVFQNSFVWLVFPVSFQMSTHTQEMYTQEQPTLNAICQCSHIQPASVISLLFSVSTSNPKTCVICLDKRKKRKNKMALICLVLLVLVDNMSANLLGVATRPGNLSLHQLQLIMS